MENFKNKILVVDDNEIIIKLSVKILQSPDRIILEAKSGQEALTVINNNTDISLILMDIQMPGIDGFETVKLIKENNETKNIPVIFITGVYKTDEFVNKGFELGAFDYIQKPFDSELLQNKVKVFLMLHNQQKLIKLQKEELDILLKSIADGVITLSFDGHINFINDSACKILGYSLDEAINKHVSDIIKPVDSNSNMPEFDFGDWLKQKGSSGKQQLPIQSKDLEKKMISLEISEIKDVGAESKGTVLVFSDVSGAVRAQNQKALSQKMESVGQLASGIAHEINTPMQFIGDNTFFIKDAFDSLIKFVKSVEGLINLDVQSDKEQLIQSYNNLKNENDIDYLTEEIPTAIERTQTGIQRVSKIVLAMKNFAHPSSKQKALSNINQGVDVTVTISRNEWKYVAELETRLEPNLPLIHCSIDEINQVILNMIVNSSHAIEEQIGMESGKMGKITIESKSDSDWVYISITDTGKGIPEEIQSRIFDPFFTTKEVGKGTGQGLAIAHDIIVNKHKGEIEVNSEPGKGTTFIIKLPINLKQESMVGGK
ncbi:MAG: hybrid sensor histidine kinase/response regulator [Bacteroidetes bacterium]|nr:MAG: hybrid sensor histidine kinase/response regulator [Bacteroidota bacterium]